MCGRYTVTDLADLANFIAHVNHAPFFAPSFNLAPRHVKPEKDYTKIAKEIWGLWQKFNGPKH
jgi:hypothetical protein